MGREASTREKFESVILEMFEEYPKKEFFGKFEYFFRENPAIAEMLEKDGFIRITSKIKGVNHYVLTSEGMNLAMSMINHRMTNKIIWLTWVMLIAVGIQIVLSISQTFF